MSTIRNWLWPAALLALFLMLNACAPGGDKKEADARVLGRTFRPDGGSRKRAGPC